MLALTFIASPAQNLLRRLVFSLSLSLVVIPMPIIVVIDFSSLVLNNQRRNPPPFDADDKCTWSWHSIKFRNGMVCGMGWAEMVMVEVGGGCEEVAGGGRLVRSRGKGRERPLSDSLQLQSAFYEILMMFE